MTSEGKQELVSDPASYFTSLAEQSAPLSIDTLEHSKDGDSQKNLQLPLFGTVGMREEDAAIQSGLAMHVGGPVWALDWCPEQRESATEAGAGPQFLAVGVHPPTVRNIQSGKAFHGKGAVQIWQVEELSAGKEGACSQKGKQKAQPEGGDEATLPGKISEDMAMEAVLPGNAHVAFRIAHDGLTVWDLKWRPVSEPSADRDSEGHVAAIGQLAAALGNGSVHVWTVPATCHVSETVTPSIPVDEAATAKKRKRKELLPGAQPERVLPVVVRLPSATFRTGHASLGRRLPLTLEWSPCAPSDLLLAGCHDGTVVLWRVPEAADSTSAHVFPLACFKTEETPVRTLAWVPPHVGGSNMLFVTGGHRGIIKFWDVRDPLQPIWTQSVSQSWILSVKWLASPRCLAIARDDGLYHVWSLDGMGLILPGCDTPGGNHTHLRKLGDGALWGTDISPLTGLVAAGASSGVVSFFQLNRYWVAGNHASNRHMQLAYRCASLTAKDEQGPVKVSLSGPQDTFASRQEAKTITTEKLRGASPEYPGDAGPSNADAGKLEKEKVGQKDKVHWRKDVATYAEFSKATGTEADKGDGSPFPPRVVSIQRVVWNPNKRYGLWLAWGGQAGVVCCHRVRLPQYETGT